MIKAIGMVEVAALAASAADSPPIETKESYRALREFHRQRR
jgi:hypothetical protein